MRITFLSTPPSLSGGHRVIAVYAKRLAELGHDVEVVCSKRRPPSIVKTAKSVLRGRPSPIWRISGPSHYDQYEVNYRIVRHPGSLVEDDIRDGDVVIATWWETAEAGATFPPSKGAKVYFVQGHEVFPHLPIERSASTYRLPYKKICVAKWLGKEMTETYQDSTSRVVPNAVDTKMFFAPIRARNPTPRVGLMYSREEFKGTDICIEAIRIVRREIGNLLATAFGHSKPVDRASLKIFETFIPSPSQGSLKDIYSSCDVWLFGSRCEGFGLPILEAMACRTPVVATPAGAAPELIEKGGGILVRTADPLDMAHAIMRILKMPLIDWQSMSTLAYNTASSYTWDDATRLFEQALEAAVAGTWNNHFDRSLQRSGFDDSLDVVR